MPDLLLFYRQKRQFAHILMDFFDFLRTDLTVDSAANVCHGTVVVGIQHFLGFKHHAAVALRPFVHAACGHGLIVQLRGRDACLHLGVIARAFSVRQILLPVLTRTVLAPCK